MWVGKWMQSLEDQIFQWVGKDREKYIRYLSLSKPELLRTVELLEAARAKTDKIKQMQREMGRR